MASWLGHGSRLVARETHRLETWLHKGLAVADRWLLSLSHLQLLHLLLHLVHSRGREGEREG